VITPRPDFRCKAVGLRAGLHAHFYYPELASDFLHRLDCNRSRCDLLLTTDTTDKANALRDDVGRYARGDVMIRVVPNRGRDIGALLTGFDDLLPQYEVIGHLHGKRSLFALTMADPTLGERRREFLWQNLVGDDCNPMLDIILDRFIADDRLGIVFAEDTHLSDWDRNLEIAEDLANRMGLNEVLPPFFDFPGGTMFWARSHALGSVFEALGRLSRRASAHRWHHPACPRAPATIRCASRRLPVCHDQRARRDMVALYTKSDLHALIYPHYHEYL
jgi:lipopolysaccharide biosynthesis protein